MRKITLYIATSLDGYIATPEGNIDWLTDFSANSDNDYGYSAFYDTIDTIIMGGRTYRDILGFDVEWPYSGKKIYVLSHHPHANIPEQNITFLSNHSIEIIKKLKQKEGMGMWIVGGSEIVHLLLEHDLIDELQITIIPTLIGNGIPLFLPHDKQSEWTLLNNFTFANGVVLLNYQKK